MEERPVAVGLGGDGGKPRVEHSELARELGQHGKLLRRESAHDVADLSRLGLRAAAEFADVVLVVADEPRHRRRGPGRRGVERCRHRPDAHGGVPGRLHAVEQLRVDVRELLAGVRVRATHQLVRRTVVHVRGDALAVGGRVGVVAERETVEALSGREGLGGVQPAEHVVEGAVLAHEDHDVVEPGCASRRNSTEIDRSLFVADAVPDRRPDGGPAASGRDHAGCRDAAEREEVTP